jgi:hypothetical protein
VIEALPPAYLALRFASALGEQGSLDAAVLAGLGVSTAVILAARSAVVDDENKALRGVVAATSAIALSAAAMGDAAAALVLSASSLVAIASGLAALEAKRDARWLGVACAGAVGLFPGGGASTGYIPAIATSLGSAATGSVAWAVAMALIASALVVAACVCSLAAYRVYDAAIYREREGETGRGFDTGRARGQGTVVIVLALAAIIGGAALGAGTTLFGGGVVPFARRLSGSAPVPPRAMAHASVVLAIVASGGGALLARRAGVATAPPAWLLALGRPYDLLALGAHGIGRVTRFLERGVTAMDRGIIDDVPSAFADIYRRMRGRSIDTEEQGPSEGGPLFTGLLLGLAAILAAIVLSSFVLG